MPSPLLLKPTLPAGKCFCKVPDRWNYAASDLDVVEWKIVMRHRLGPPLPCKRRPLISVTDGSKGGSRTSSFTPNTNPPMYSWRWALSHSQHNRTLPTVPLEPLLLLRLFHARTREEFAQPIDDCLWRLLHLADLRRHLAAAEPVDVEANAARLLQIGFVLHRGLEGRLQRRDALGRHLWRQHHRPRHVELERIEAHESAVLFCCRKLNDGRHVLERGQALGAVLQQDAHLAIAQPIRLVDGEIGEAGVVALHLSALGRDVDLVLALIAGHDLHARDEERVGERGQDRIVS